MAQRVDGKSELPGKMLGADVDKGIIYGG